MSIANLNEIQLMEDDFMPPNLLIVCDEGPLLGEPFVSMVSSCYPVRNADEGKVRLVLEAAL